MNKVRVDKWLWAARFFKTRSLAKQAIEGGKIRCDGHRIKASKDITVGLLLGIRIGWNEKEVEVLALSDIRRGAPDAQALYRETEASIERQAKRAAEFTSLHGSTRPTKRPTKKQRRQIHRFREQDFESDQS